MLNSCSDYQCKKKLHNAKCLGVTSTQNQKFPLNFEYFTFPHPFHTQNHEHPLTPKEGLKLGSSDENLLMKMQFYTSFTKNCSL